MTRYHRLLLLSVLFAAAPLHGEIFSLWPFGEGSAEGLYRGEGVKLKVAYFPDLNVFRGVESVEFIMTDYSA